MDCWQSKKENAAHRDWRDWLHSLADPADPLWELECRKGLEGVKVGVVREGRWVGRVWVGGGGEVGVGDRGGKGGSRYL